MKKRSTFAILIAAVLFIAGCSTPQSPVSQPDPAAMRQLTDDLGRSVSVPAKIIRAVSLAPNLTENVFAVGAGDRLVGVTSFCNFPEAAKSIAKIGDTMNPNMESIVALKPEVVLVSTASQIEAFSSTLATSGIAVFVTNPDSVDAMFRNLEQLGSLFGTTAKAEELVNGLRNRLKKLEARRSTMPADRVFVQISKEPLFTIGKQSFLTAALEKIGAISVTKDVETAYPKLSKETALALKPEVLILSESDDNREPNSAFAASPAIKDGNVLKVNADLISRPGPRLIDALEQIEAELGRIKFAREAKN
jgi:iron complex transport system substrate-binding protein